MRPFISLSEVLNHREPFLVIWHPGMKIPGVLNHRDTPNIYQIIKCQQIHTTKAAASVSSFHIDQMILSSGMP